MESCFARTNVGRVDDDTTDTEMMMMIPRIGRRRAGCFSRSEGIRDLSSLLCNLLIMNLLQESACPARERHRSISSKSKKMALKETPNSLPPPAFRKSLSLHSSLIFRIENDRRRNHHTPTNSFSFSDKSSQPAFRFRAFNFGLSFRSCFRFVSNPGFSFHFIFRFDPGFRFDAFISLRFDAFVSLSFRFHFGFSFRVFVSGFRFLVRFGLLFRFHFVSMLLFRIMDHGFRFGFGLSFSIMAFVSLRFFDFRFDPGFCFVVSIFVFFDKYQNKRKARIVEE
jgi:hypothetical protein